MILLPKGVVGRTSEEDGKTSGLVKSDIGPSFRFYGFPGKVGKGTKVTFKLYQDKETKGTSGKYGIVRELNGIRLPKKPKKA